MTSEKRQNRTIIGFILLSLLLHLLLLLTPKDRLFPQPAVPEPVYVEVRPPQPRDRELDLPIRKELVKPREKPAKRLAEQSQVVEKERAPEGKDIEDRQQSVRAQKPTQQTPPPSPAEPRAKQQPAEKSASESTRPTTPDGWLQKPEQKPAITPNVPDLKSLTQISQNTLAQIESDWRHKYREDISKDDTVWMDTEQDLLISFMRRFRDNIYGVWNYPAAEAERGREGTCLLRITISLQGEIEDVQVLESSGFRALDEEAVRAVRKGATYGPLPKAYPNQDLKIMAFFQYRADKRIRRTRRRPGDIY